MACKSYKIIPLVQLENLTKEEFHEGYGNENDLGDFDEKQQRKQNDLLRAA